MMLGIEDILCEFADEDHGHGFPPGFRFHPTDEELITFYLASKVFNGGSLCPLDIAEVDLNKCEPWDLPDVAKMGKKEWYFYSLRDRKYPSGLRTNRATATGYWKATGKDKEIHNAAALIGMKKTLVFYLGRAPRGQKTKWVMHEYRLHGEYSSRAAKEEWVICKICSKSGEKTNMLLNGIGSQCDPASSTSRKESLLPQLIDSHPCEQILKNQASVFPRVQTRSEENRWAPQMYNNPLQAGPLAPYIFQPASHYPPTATGVNPSASFSSMLISSLVSSESQNNNLIKAKNISSELVKTEPNFPQLLQGADVEWIHGIQHTSSQHNNHNKLDADANGGGGRYTPYNSYDVELSRGGCLQMIVDPNFRIPTGEFWALDA